MSWKNPAVQDKHTTSASGVEGELMNVPTGQVETDLHEAWPDMSWNWPLGQVEQTTFADALAAMLIKVPG